tara:strand:- start:817 stop:1266 length:450 start_codon:yes stop_codon:yes gene_type:complete
VIELLPLIVVGLLISIMLLRRSSREAMGIELSWLQAVKVVTVRAAVGIGTGFLVGRVVGEALSNGWFSLSVLQENVFLFAPVGVLCAVASFFTYRKLVQVVSGRTVSIAVMARSVARELGYYVRLLALVFVVLLVILLFLHWSGLLVSF